MGDAYAGVFVVATILVAACLIPAFLLPRSKPAARSTRQSSSATDPSETAR